METNRRRAERVLLEEPLSATLGETPVEVAEIGLIGAKLVHAIPLRIGPPFLTFYWRGNEITVECRVIRTERALEGRHFTGVEFVQTGEVSGRLIRELIAVAVSRALEELKANSRGERPETIPFLSNIGLRDDAQRSSTQSFRIFELSPTGEWTEHVSPTPIQPMNGFAVLPTLSDEEIAKLKTTYSEGDPETRRLIRLFAEMSLTEDDRAIPPQRLK